MSQKLSAMEPKLAAQAAWTKEVEKMVKWGAIVDASDRDSLIDYLSTNFSPERPPYVPPRGC